MCRSWARTRSFAAERRRSSGRNGSATPVSPSGSGPMMGTPGQRELRSATTLSVSIGSAFNTTMRFGCLDGVGKSSTSMAWGSATTSQPSRLSSDWRLDASVTTQVGRERLHHAASRASGSPAPIRRYIEAPRACGFRRKRRRSRARCRPLRRGSVPCTT